MATFNVTNGNDSGTGSFRQAVLDANNNPGLDIIEFDVDLVTIESAINVTDSVDLNGNIATVNQTGTDRIFNINNNSDSLIDVSVNNLTLTGGRPDELGGAIYTVENLVVNESVFRDNVTSKRGGGIYSEGAALTITNSLFEENEVVGEYTTSSGGAFHIRNGGTLTVNNSSFINNKSFIHAVAIDSSQVQISNSKFNSNSGGAISAFNDSTVAIERVEVTNNFNQISGAGISGEDSQVTITDSIINNNQSNYGAGVFVGRSQIEIINTNITNNYANKAAGGINVVDYGGQLTLRNSTLSGNSSPIGSAIETYENGSAYIVDSTITNNTGSQNQLEGSNIRFGGANTGGILDPFPADENVGTDGQDTLTGGADSDTLEGLGNRDLLLGREGDDFLYGGAGKDTLKGNEGNDYLKGNGGDDILHGNVGNDVLFGDAGRDELVGWHGDDSLLGGLENDTLKGNDGRDFLHGGSSNDVLFGGAGNDTLRGGKGNDYLNGGDSNDVLIGNIGNDVLFGGEGKDMFLLNDYTYGTETIKDFNLNDDRIGLGNGMTYDTVEISGDANAILSYSGNQIAVLENISPDSLNENHFKDL